MMLSREVKRVPMDFDWPVDKVWEGYLSPDPGWPTCRRCDGDGIHPQAKPITESFYALYVHDEATRRQIQWSDKITQDEVDHLLDKDRLPTWVRDDTKRGGHWEQLPRTADEVNALNRRGGLDSHDGINRWILCKYRCERLGIPYTCDGCEGHGNLASDEDRKRAEEWTPTEPPEGEGWQMWESVSEGSPISPVFATAEALASWLTDNPRGITERMGYADWLAAIQGNNVVGTDVATGEPVRP